MAKLQSIRKRIPYGLSLMERFMRKMIPEPNSGCWLWTECVGNGGYGCMAVGADRQGAHRVAYELFKGPIPKGMDLDHLCRVHCCCNPDHLEPVTRKENLRRGVTGQKTKCHNGHEYSTENTLYRKGSGKKQCRLCARVLDRNRKRAKRKILALGTNS